MSTSSRRPVYNEFYTIQSRMPQGQPEAPSSPRTTALPFPRDTLIVSETTAKEKPDLVKAFLRASLKGWKEAFADPKGAIDTVMAVAPTLDRAHQEFMLVGDEASDDGRQGGDKRPVLDRPRRGQDRPRLLPRSTA